MSVNRFSKSRPITAARSSCDATNKMAAPTLGISSGWRLFLFYQPGFAIFDLLVGTPGRAQSVFFFGVFVINSEALAGFARLGDNLLWTIIFSNFLFSPDAFCLLLVLLLHLFGRRLLFAGLFCGARKRVAITNTSLQLAIEGNGLKHVRSAVIRTSAWPGWWAFCTPLLGVRRTWGGGWS